MSERDTIKTGQRRTATILFSDMKGFPSLPELAFRLLQDEKARLGGGALVANFLSLRSYGKIQKLREEMS